MKPINIKAMMKNMIATGITDILAEQQFFLFPTKQHQLAQLQLTSL